MPGTCAVAELDEAEARGGTGAPRRAAIARGEPGLSRRGCARDLGCGLRRDEAAQRRDRGALSRSSNAPTARATQVGAAPAEGFAKVRHAVRMLSLGQCLHRRGRGRISTRAVRRFLGLGRGRAACPSPPSRRSTGCRSSLRYEGGRLVQAATRGDGAEGRERHRQCPHHRRHSRAARRRAPEVLEVRGEVYMSHADFAALNARQAAAAARPSPIRATRPRARCASSTPRSPRRGRCASSPMPGARFPNLWPRRRARRDRAACAHGASRRTR